ncbi:hypothetical protein ASG67_00135 [Sphingomonas sp. Leaf339]|uniref:hypothetical protein n=1 Tax=Sphingomonas sp. Leaf339 TaxID=1736343 RepID=UPI0006FF4F36|nr:hypothetical protein [Sphingomonas sp. Leaf339]KQU61645.1 hypothetical protein ASG67_00135 [Sphingomonas sp. Leaf339]
MILIIARPDDVAALWLHAAIRAFVTVPVRLLTPAALVYTPSIVHRMATGSTDWRVSLRDDTSIGCTDVTGIVNRLTAAPNDHFARAGAGERAYAESELHAFLLGWLGSMNCPVLNPPAPEGLAGVWHDVVGAWQRATMAGFACDPVDLSPDRPLPTLPQLRSSAIDEGTTHFVLDDQVIGPHLSRTDRDAMLHLARSWGTRLIQIDTRDDAGRPTFVTATSLPHYPMGGGLLVRAMARALTA